LKGKTFASPVLGGTQDVALKAYLVGKGYAINKDVTVTPTENATTLTLFKNGTIDGAWVPEPWASRLVLEGKGRVFVDEKTLWKGGKFTTTSIVAKKTFLDKYPKAVTAIIKANLEAISFIKKSPAKAQDLVQAELLKQTGKKLADDVIARAWPSLTFTADPLAATLKLNADAAVDAGLLSLKSLGLRTIFDLRLLNAELKATKQKTVSAAGNGKQ
jgi:NitT/TauT family transport system substrate-binding protein